MTSRLDIANDMDALDQSIADLNASKAEMWSDYREGLIARGMAKDAARAEVAALKAAIRRRRAVTKDSAAVEEMDALVDEIFTEISRTAHGAREYSEAAE